MKKIFDDRIEYYNDKGELHREDGPAVEWYIGEKWWYINGKRHREDGPAVELSDGDKWWCLNDETYIYEEDYRDALIKLKLNRLKYL